MIFKLLLFATILLGLILRLWNLNLPLLEFNPSRQIQTAEITRNFYKYDLPITKPSVSYLGPDLVPYLVEFPGYNYAIALVYRITSSPDEVYGRIFSIIGWILSTYFLYKIAKKYIGDFGAKVALFYYTFSPLSILVSRSFQPDQWMVTMSLASIYFLDRWRQEQLLFYLAAIAASLALLLKIPALIFTLIPAVFILKHKNVRLASSQSIIYFAIALLPSALWYLYATYVSRMGEVLRENVVLANWFGFEIFLNSKYYSNIFGFEMNLVLGPIGILLFLIGLFQRLKNTQHLLYFWLGSVILYFLIFNKHNMTHEYYHLPLLPIATIFIGIAVTKIYAVLNNLIFKKDLVLTTLGLFVFASLFVITWTRAYKPIDRFGYVFETADAIKRLTNQNDLIIGLMDEGPSLVYYSDRTGWGFEVDPKKLQTHRKFIGFNDASVINPIDKLEELKSKGAVVFASSFKPQLLQNKEFSQYIYERYTILKETDNYVIFDIKKTKNAI